MNINADWHKTHKMPKNPTYDERLEWHREHTKHCSCWPMPKKLLEDIKKKEGKI